MYFSTLKIFIENGINGEAVLLMNEADLHDIGIFKKGPIMLILNFINKFSNTNENKSPNAGDSQISNQLANESAVIPFPVNMTMYHKSIFE